MDVLKIERLGGFGGFGLPGSNLKSSGELPMSALSAADQGALEALFKRPPAASREQAPHAFRYRITRSAGGGEETIEVPESAVPSALTACVTDKLL